MTSAPARKRSHWWVTAGAVAVTATTILGGVIPVLNYFHDKQTAQIQERSDWAAKNALLSYRLDEAERDIQQLREEHQHDIDQLRQECRP